MKMKLQQRILSVLAILSLALFSSCGSDEGGKTAPEKTQLKKLTKTWNIVSAELDDVSRTADFSGFKLTIDGVYDKDATAGDFPYDFSVSGSRPDPSPWEASGNWEFGSSAETQIVRDDGVGITYSINSSGELSMTFQCISCNYAGSRVGQVNGIWEFKFN
jgi:hypothetical protein